MIEAYEGIRIRCSCGTVLYEGPTDPYDRKRVLTQNQFRVAHAIARIFGHDWAIRTDADAVVRSRRRFYDVVGLWDIAGELHDRWSNISHQAWEHGILLPRLVWYGTGSYVEETTASKLIRWTVAPDGSLRMRFGRLRATIIWTPTDGYRAELSNDTPGRDPAGPDTLPEWEWFDRIADFCIALVREGGKQ